MRCTMAGRRIDDHSAWMGRPGKGVPMPMETKMKEERSADGNERSGSLDYPDTTEAIHRDQEHSMRKSNSQKMKPGYRY